MFRQKNYTSFKMFTFVVFLTFSFPVLSRAADITLAWDKPAGGSTVTGYYLYFGISGTNYKSTPQKTISSGNTTSCLVSGLEQGKTYVFAATSFDGSSTESGFSNEISYQVPVQPPVDSDSDGLTDEQEKTYGTNPLKADTDIDGINDAQEITYWAAKWNADADGDSIINILDPDSDNDGVNDGTEISQGTDPGVKDPGTPSGIPIETGKIDIDTQWKTVTFTHNFTAPVIVASPMSNNDLEPGVVRISNVTPQGFDIRVQEWDYLDGVHGRETVSYIVMESGRRSFPDGTQVEAGTFTANVPSSNLMKAKTVAFSKTFTKVPVVVTSVTSLNGSQAVTGRNGNVTTSGFNYNLQEQEAYTDGHGYETIAYIAWEPSSGEIDGMSYEVGHTPSGIDYRFKLVLFKSKFAISPNLVADMQTFSGFDTATLRYRNEDLLGVELSVAEESSRDEEVKHAAETVGYILLER